MLCRLCIRALLLVQYSFQDDPQFHVWVVACIGFELRPIAFEHLDERVSVVYETFKVNGLRSGPLQYLGLNIGSSLFKGINSIVERFFQPGDTFFQGAYRALCVEFPPRTRIASNSFRIPKACVASKILR